MKLFLSILIVLFLVTYVTPSNLFEDKRVVHYEMCEHKIPKDLDSSEREMLVYLCQKEYKGD